MNTLRDIKGRFAPHTTSVECYWSSCNKKVPKNGNYIAHCSEEHFNAWHLENDYPIAKKTLTSPEYMQQRIEKLRRNALHTKMMNQGTQSPLPYKDAQ